MNMIEVAKGIVEALLPPGSKVEEIKITKLVIDGKVLVDNE